MNQFHIHIKCDTEPELKEELREAAYILTGLREATVQWQNVYGTEARIRKEKFEKLADAFINRHKVIINKKSE